MNKYLTRKVNYKDLTIGIYADSFNGKTGVTQPYMNFVQLFGTPFIITAGMNPEKVVKMCDMLIVPGGADVDSRRYGEAPHPTNSRANMHYEWLDEFILKPFINSEKPIFGICRGFQTINVTLGGSLYQNITGHAQSESRDTLTDDLLYYDKGKKILTPINSIHHQAAKKLGKGLTPIGFTFVNENCESLQDKNYLYNLRHANTLVKGQKKPTKYLSICEAFQHESLPIAAVQYHPEEFNCPFAINLIDTMLNNTYSVNYK